MATQAFEILKLIWKAWGPKSFYLGNPSFWNLASAMAKNFEEFLKAGSPESNYLGPQAFQNQHLCKTYICSFGIKIFFITAILVRLQLSTWEKNWLLLIIVQIHQSANLIFSWAMGDSKGNDDDQDGTFKNRFLSSK